MKNMHDYWGKMLLTEYKKLEKDEVISKFLASFNDNDKRLRSGLPVFAIMQKFKKHDFVLREDQELSEFSPCKICSSYYGSPQNLDSEEIDLLEESINTGGLVGDTLEIHYYYLKSFQEIEKDFAPTPKAIDIFKQILNTILSAKPTETLKEDIVKKIGRISGFKANAEERQVLLETLGYCSILETDEHKGLLNQYINLATAPMKTQDSDWKYPVDFWLGRDGINKKAFRFWFGGYKELEAYWK